jgi:hypothetical protein
MKPDLHYPAAAQEPIGAPAARFELLRREGRLIRLSWTGTDTRGRETACWLAALAPEVGRAMTPAACPADIMPRWLAHLTVWLDDAPSDEAWPGLAARFGGLAGRWRVLAEDDWRRLDYTARRISVEAAHPFAGAAADAVAVVLALLRRAEAGEAVTAAEWNEAEDAADRAEENASEEAEEEAASAAAAAAALVPLAAAQAAEAVARAASGREDTTAAQVVADAIATRILDAIEGHPTSGASLTEPSASSLCDVTFPLRVPSRHDIRGHQQGGDNGLHSPSGTLRRHARRGVSLRRE